MAYKLPAEVYSRDQIPVCADELRREAGRLTKAQRMKIQGASELSVATTALIAGLPVAKQQDPEALEQLADTIEATAVQGPIAHVTLAAAAPTELKQEIVAWFRQNTFADVLLVFQVNPDIAGGLVVRTTNRIHDMSFRTHLLGSAERFSEVLARV